VTGDLTYPEVGATRGRDLPSGYRRVVARARLGTGPRVYAAAVAGLRGFDMQRRAGLRVRSDAEQATPGVNVSVGLGVGPVRLWAPCRVVWVTDEPARFGYAYGTLPGHPESGEEAFEVSLVGDGVWLEIRAFSRPGRWYTRLAGPVGHLVQGWATGRYRDALRRLATYA
jgi:uncharacterized protein (UPF0548 family)